MKFEQMREIVNTIKLLEKDLMRPLTEEEKEVVAVNGWKVFINHYLDMSDEEFSIFKKIRKVLSAYYTQDDEAYKAALKECNEHVYFTLREIASDIEETEYYTPDLEAGKEAAILDEFTNFLQHLYESLKPADAVWFDKLTEEIRADLFEIYKDEKDKNDEDTLGGIITDAIKDEIIDDLVEQLKAHREVEMTNDEFMEVADYLTEHEDHVYLVNNNGKVVLK